MVTDVDLEILRRHRYSGAVQNWKDRRAELYRIHYRDPEGQLEV